MSAALAALLAAVSFGGAPRVECYTATIRVTADGDLVLEQLPSKRRCTTPSVPLRRR